VKRLRRVASDSYDLADELERLDRQAARDEAGNGTMSLAPRRSS
jgi:hypothetical protein